MAELIEHLRWWQTVNEILLREPAESQAIFRMWMEGLSVDESRRELINRGVKRPTKFRVEQTRRIVLKHIEAALTPPGADQWQTR